MIKYVAIIFLRSSSYIWVQAFVVGQSWDLNSLSDGHRTYRCIRAEDGHVCTHVLFRIWSASSPQTPRPMLRQSHYRPPGGLPDRETEIFAGAVAIPLPCRCHAAMPPCRCHALTMPLPVAMPLPIAMPLPLPCRCHGPCRPRLCAAAAGRPARPPLAGASTPALERRRDGG